MDEHLHKYQAYKNLKRILRYLSPYSIMFSILVVLSVFYLFIDLVKPLLYGYFFSSLYNQDPQLSAKVIFFGVIANTLATGIRWGKSTISSVIQNNILVDVRKEIFSKLLNIPLTKFKQLGAGRFITLLYSDASIICNILNERLINTIFSLLSLIVIGIIIFKTSWMLGIIVLTFSPILFTIFVYWGKVLKERGREYKLWEDGYVFRIQHFIQGIEEIKGMGIKERIYDLFVVSTVEIRKRRLALSKSSINAQPFISLSNMIQYVLMMSDYFAPMSPVRSEAPYPQFSGISPPIRRGSPPVITVCS